MTAPGPGAVAGGSRVPASAAGAGRGEAGALSGYSPRPRRHRLFRASWPRSGPAGRRRPPPPAPRPAPRARAPRPLTCHRRRLAQHQPPTPPLRGQRERERPPAPRARPAPAARPDLLAVPQLDLALHQRRLGHLLSWFPRARRASPRRPAAAQTRVTFKIAPGGPCAGRRGGRGGARAGPRCAPSRPCPARAPPRRCAPRHLRPPERPPEPGTLRGSAAGAPALLTPGGGGVGANGLPSKSKGNARREGGVRASKRLAQF